MANWRWECQTCQKAKACHGSGICFACSDDKCEYEPFKNFATTSTKYPPSELDCYTSNTMEQKINGLDKFKGEPLNLDLETDINKLKNDYISAVLESFGYSNVKESNTRMSDNVNHPSHYDGEDNPYEAIKVIEAWNLGFCLGNAVKYISRVGKKDKSKEVEDLEKAVWYLQREINKLKGEQK